MSTPAELEAQIRFQLSQLSSNNAHHEFEHLARHLARARVYSNILPATGPVSAGGDGGRDFQTFRVAAQVASGPRSSFRGRSSGDVDVAFACSLQKEIEPKIRRDIANILAHGPADEIVYFCTSEIPIGHRLRLEAEAREQNVELRIFDGFAIASMLADPDVFWITQRYLGLPAEMLPARHDDVDWYSGLRSRWRGRDVIPISQADFFELKSGIRHATFEEEARPDLLNWMTAMEGFLSADTPRALVRAGSYELAVAALRGLGDMTPRAGLLLDYFSDMEDWPGHADLQDAATLLTYAFTAQHLGQLDFDVDRLIAWRNLLSEMIDAEFSTAPGPGRQSALLQVRGHISTLPAARDSRPDREAGVADWNRMLDIAEHAPLYPLETFADFLSRILTYVPDSKAIRTLATRVDVMLVKRGGAVAAQKAMDRAKALLRHDRPSDALSDLHAAKHRWFDGDHVDDMIETLLTLSSVYRRLGLGYAAKYYAMAGAFIAKHDARREVAALQPQALQLATEAECVLGNSLGYLTLLLVTLDAHVRLEHDPLDRDKHPWLHQNLSFMAAHLSALHRGAPELEPTLTEVLATWPEEITAGVMKVVDAPEAEWNQGDWAQTANYFRQVLLDRPFSDIGPIREARWSALGIHWTARFANTYAVTPLAEQLIAQLQLAQASMAGRDFGLTPERVTLDLTVSDTASTLDAHWTQEDQEAVCKVTLPAAGWGESQDRRALEVCMFIVNGCTVLSGEDFVRALDPTVVGQIYLARPYAEIARDFVEEEDFHETARHGSTGFRRDDPWPTTPHPDLDWFDGQGPNYDEPRALSDIDARYRTGMRSAGHTIRRFSTTPHGRTLLSQWRAEGAKDWEIIAILANLAMNQRLPDIAEKDPETAQRLAWAMLEQEEAPDDALDLSDLTAETYVKARRIYLGAHLRSWGVEIPKAASWDGVERFLITRYRMRENDVPHENYLDWLGEGADPPALVDVPAALQLDPSSRSS
jgi:hypothetical protein